MGHYLARLDPDGPEPDPTEGRSLTMARRDDGGLSGRFDLDAVGGEKLQAALESILQAARPAGDMRTRAQHSADALVQLCDNALASGNLPVLRTVKPHVAVRIDLADLVDPAPGPGAARLGFGATISAARARWPACDIGIARIVLGPDGQPLDLGRTHGRSAGARRELASGGGRSGPFIRRLRRPALLVRRPPPGHPQGPAASLRVAGRGWSFHTPCVHHGYRIERDTDGRWHTYRPDGTEILVLPRITDDTIRSRAG